MKENGKCMVGLTPIVELQAEPLTADLLKPED